MQRALEQPTTVGGSGTAISSLVAGGTAELENSYTFSVVASGSVSDYTTQDKETMKESVAATAGVLSSQVTLQFEAGSVLITCIIAAYSSSQLTTAVAASAIVLWAVHASGAGALRIAR